MVGLFSGSKYFILKQRVTNRCDVLGIGWRGKNRIYEYFGFNNTGMSA